MNELKGKRERGPKRGKIDYDKEKTKHLKKTLFRFEERSPEIKLSDREEENRGFDGFLLLRTDPSSKLIAERCHEVAQYSKLDLHRLAIYVHSVIPSSSTQRLRRSFSRQTRNLSPLTRIRRYIYAPVSLLNQLPISNQKQKMESEKKTYISIT